MGEVLEIKVALSDGELLYAWIRPLEPLPADAAAKLGRSEVYVSRKNIVEAGPVLKVGAKVRFKIHLDPGDVLASDIIAACDEAYEVGLAAAATGPTATTWVPAAPDEVKNFQRLASLAEKFKSLQRDYPDVRERWAEHCGTNHNVVKDPYRHTEASLRFFRDLHSL